MTFRRTLLLGMGALLLLVLVGTAAAVVVVVDRAARQEAAEDLARSRRVFEELNGYRRALFDSEVHVVAEEPRLKAVVASEETTPETVFGVMSDLRRAVGSDALLITDADGRIIADVSDPQATGQSLADNPTIARALEQGQAQGVWVDASHALQVHARAVAFGANIVGVLALGHRLDDAVAGTVHQQTGSALAILLDGQIIAASPFPGALESDRAALAAALAKVSDTGATPARLDLGGETFLALAGPYPGYEGEANLRFVLARSLDEAVATSRRLLAAVAGVLLLVALVAAIFAMRLSRRLSRPIAEMMQFARRIAGGELMARADVQGPTEIVSLGHALNEMALELDHSRQELARKERLEQEMEIAARLQTSILPRRFEIKGLDIAARMLPASEVGGDYYDVIRVKDGAWIGIGDVAGHGLSAGVIMLMIQNLVSALVKAMPHASPRELLGMMNEVLYDNVRQRLGRDEHTTLSLLRFDPGGKITYAGAHEVMLLCRARTGRCEQLANPGTWVGAMRDVRRFTVDTEVTLARGDVLVLYTDGLTEAINEHREQFGIDRLSAVIEAHHTAPVDEIRDRVFEAVKQWTTDHVDDMTVMVLRYVEADARNEAVRRSA